MGEAKSTGMPPAPKVNKDEELAYISIHIGQHFDAVKAGDKFLVLVMS
jgi:hypothetical protein